MRHGSPTVFHYATLELRVYIVGDNYLGQAHITHVTNHCAKPLPIKGEGRPRFPSSCSVHRYCNYVHFMMEGEERLPTRVSKACDRCKRQKQRVSDR